MKGFRALALKFSEDRYECWRQYAREQDERWRTAEERVKAVLEGLGTSEKVLEFARAYESVVAEQRLWTARLQLLFLMRMRAAGAWPQESG